MTIPAAALLPIRTQETARHRAALPQEVPLQEARHQEARQTHHWILIINPIGILACLTDS